MQKKVLEKEIRELLNALTDLKRTELRNEIERIHSMSVLEYSRSIYDYKPRGPVEQVLIQAFEKELKRLDYEEEEIGKIISTLKNRRIIQCAPHLVPTFGPRLLTIDWQTSLGLSPTDYYIVSMYSGIPFSNDWFPGKLIFNPKFKVEDVISKDSAEYEEVIKNQNSNGKKKEKEPEEKRITIIPSKMQDELVFRSEMAEKTKRIIGAMVPALKGYFDHPSLHQNSYSKWVITSCRNLLEKALERKKLVYLDINEVISNYLVEVLSNSEHILYKIFFDPETREKFLKHLPNEKIFLIPYESSGFESQESMNIKGDALLSKHKRIELKPEILIKALKEDRLCPGLLLSFTILSFLNGFKSMGSFRQAVYLPEYKQKWLESGLLNSDSVKDIPACNITTGSFLESPLSNIHPLDIALGEKFDPDPNMLYGEFILSVKDRFLE